MIWLVDRECKPRYNNGGINEENETALEEAPTASTTSTTGPENPCSRPVGGVTEDNRRFANAVFWALRAGWPWRDLPPGYGGWENVTRRFCRWRDKGVWERLLEAVIRRAGLRVADGGLHMRQGPPRRDGGRGRHGSMRPHKRGPNTKACLAVDAHGMPVRFAVTAGTEADCLHLPALIEGLPARFILADRGYDTEVCPVRALGAETLIPPRRCRLEQRPFDKHLTGSAASSRTPSRG